ncbi:Major facilitator superfamily (MFS) profile domain-containing protein [[Candida] zeylanoides]
MNRSSLASSFVDQESIDSSNCAAESIKEIPRRDENTTTKGVSQTYNDELEYARVPSIAEEALSRKLSQIQSRRSSNNPTSTVANSRRASSIALESAVRTQSAAASNADNRNRFSNAQKHFLVAMASCSCFLSPMSGLAFLPAVPEIAADFNTTGEILNISAAVYCVFMAISPCIFSPCSDIYGRRPTYIICLFFNAIFTILVAVSQDVAMFYVFRAMSALFGTAFFTTAAHMMGDIYAPTERGTAMGFVLTGAQLGPALGPVLGGIIVTYTSWRVIFWVLGATNFAMSALMFFFMPETSAQTKMSIAVNEINRIREEDETTSEGAKKSRKTRFVWIPYNPFTVIEALKYPNLLLGGFVVMSLTYTMYGLLTPIRYVVDPRFNLTKPIYGALFYLPPGVGYLVGSLYGGRWADRVVKRNIRVKRCRIPEDRIKAILIPLGFVYPVSMLIFGWTLQTEKGGMAVPIVVMFFGGIAQTFVFPATNTYCVDSMPELGGDAVGTSYCTRYIASAVASATCLKSINSIGIGLTCTISAIVLWVATGCAVILIYRGERLRINALKRAGILHPSVTPESKRRHYTDEEIEKF